MRSIYYLLLLGVALGTIALVTRSGIFARMSPKDRPINSAMREALDKQIPQLSFDDEATIQRVFASAHKAPSGLRYVVRNPGTGDAMPKNGNEVIVHYSGRLLDGTEFDSSYRTGVPLTFPLGAGKVIKGWDEAFTTMHKGEKRTLIIPHWLAYGPAGRKPNIPPKATLIFEVELLDWR